MTLATALRALPAHYRDPKGRATLLQADAVDAMQALPEASADLVFADPPYRLSNGGTTCSGGRRVAVAKGAWDAATDLVADHGFTLRWLRAARRLLRPSGTLWVSGTHHVIFSVGFAMQELGFHTLNVVTWFKPNAAPNLGCRQLTHSTELLIWAAPARLDPLPHVFNYQAMRGEAGGRQLRDLWRFLPPGPEERLHGSHPTQKPLALLERVVACCTNPGAWVVDPFNGSGTTGVAAVAAGRRYVGIDLDPGWLDLTRARLQGPLRGRR